MKLNKKGFTLIESIITFAILAIAGGMFILGFYNVSVIASEGAIIKTETNDLYNSVVSEQQGDKQPSYSLTFTFDDNTTFESKCWYVQDESKFDDYVIRLSRYIPAVSLDEWAEPETSDNEMIDATIRYRLRWPMSDKNADFPYYKKDKNGNDVLIGLTNNNFVGGIARNYYEDDSIKINKNTVSSSYNEQYILNNLKIFPTKKEIKQKINQYTNNDIIWFQIQKQSGSSFDVIGFEIPSGCKNRTVVMAPDGTMLINDEPKNCERDDLESAFAKAGNKDATAKSILDGKSYTSEEIYENRLKYKINIYTIEK